MLWKKKTAPPPPLVEEYRRINSKSKVVLEYWVFCILQAFVKQ